MQNILISVKWVDGGCSKVDQLYACICVCDFIYSNTFEVPVVHNKKLEEKKNWINFIFLVKFFGTKFGTKKLFLPLEDYAL